MSVSESPSSALRPATGADADPGEVTDDASYDARQAVHVGLWVSATRCVLTYVVAPLVGVLGVALGPIGLVLQLLGAVTATAGARRLWRLDHVLRIPYAGVAIAVDLVTLLALADVLGIGPR